jgi:hypothetical protein
VIRQVTMTELGLDVLWILYVANWLSLLALGIPPFVAFVRNFKQGGNYQPQRFMWFSVCFSIMLRLGWQIITLWDFNYNDQQLVGSLMTRWPIDVTIVFLAQAAMTYALFVMYSPMWRNSKNGRV